MAKAELTKELLINTALNIICERSYKGVRLQDIADEVGLSRGAIYWNFKNKLDLYDQVVKEAFGDRMRELYQILEQDIDVISIITQVVEYLLGERLDMNCKSAKLYNGLMLEQPEGLKPIIARVDRLFETLFAKHSLVLSRGIKTNELRHDCDINFETRALYNFIWGYFTTRDRFFALYTPEELKDYIINKFILSLKA